jgi:hypothetical protein
MKCNALIGAVRLKPLIAAPLANDNPFYEISVSERRGSR